MEKVNKLAQWLLENQNLELPLLISLFREKRMIAIKMFWMIHILPQILTNLPILRQENLQQHNLIELIKTKNLQLHIFHEIVKLSNWLDFNRMTRFLISLEVFDGL